MAGILAAPAGSVGIIADMGIGTLRRMNFASPDRSYAGFVSAALASPVTETIVCRMVSNRLNASRP